MDAAPLDTVATALRAQLSPRYDRYPETHQRRHAALLASVTGPTDLAMEAAPAPEGLWELSIGSGDAVGALSLIAGLLTAAGLDIVEADIYTVRIPTPVPLIRPRRAPGVRALPLPPPPPVPPQTVPRILDIFRVRLSARPDRPGWDSVRDGLEAHLREALALLAAGRGEEARERVTDAVGEAMREARTEAALLWPISVETAVEADSTALHIRGQDTPGFLFAITNALALLGVNIRAAEVRTPGGETDDTLWITETTGAPLHDETRLRQVRAAVSIIKQFTALLPHAPDPALALRQFGALTRQIIASPDWAARLPGLAAGDVQQTLAGVMGASAFLWEDFLRMQHGTLFPLLADASALDAPVPRDALRQRLRAEVDAVDAADPMDAASLDGRADALHTFRDREMFRIDLRHITGRVDFRGFADELSDLADTVIEEAARQVAAELDARFGAPRLPGGGACEWAAFALGKLGGREIGFASDIELLFAYTGDGRTDGPTPVDNAAYFEAFVQAFLRILPTRREGIFAIDLRLRPYGDHGSLASSLPALEAYYRADGPALPFERMALVKLRTVTGSASLGSRVQAVRDRFVYSSAPVDYADLRHLRARQANELVTPGAVNAKYSPGGVVDIEYRVQAAQIEAGATHAEVRVTSTLDAIDRLVAAGALAPDAAARMREAYAFLRRLIDALRVVRGNAHDLTVPPSGSREFAYLARRLELGPPALAAVIERQMAAALHAWDTDGGAPFTHS